MKEFNLSEKISICYDIINERKPDKDDDINNGFIKVPNVKEFIKKLKEKLCGKIILETPFSDLNIKQQLDLIIDEVDKIAGDKLI